MADCVIRAVVAQSEPGHAVAYTLKNWTALTRYCGDGDVSTDNNAAERVLRA
jgi:transposase